MSDDGFHEQILERKVEERLSTGHYICSLKMLSFCYKNFERSTEGWISVNGSVPIELPETIRFNSDVAFFARDDNEGSPGNIIQLPRRGKS